MSRRPRRNRPPRLDDPPPCKRPADEAVDTERAAEPASPSRRLVAGHVAGPHPLLGRTEVEHLVAQLVAGAPEAMLGLDLGRVSRDEAHAAIDAIWGWDGKSPRAAIDPKRTLEAADAAADVLASAAVPGARIALGTGRPAALLPLYRGLAAALSADGAEVLACERQAVEGAAEQVLWWHDGVAVVSDGLSVLADDGLLAGREWLFVVGRPKLAIADHGFAAAAIGEGHQTIALADLDALALGVAARRGMPVCVVPIHDGAPPSAYEVILERLVPHRARDAHESHSTTRAPDA
ncbi:MAG: phosphatase [Acidimicrobiia bacterium]